MAQEAGATPSPGGGTVASRPPFIRCVRMYGVASVREGLMLNLTSLIV